MAKWYVIYTKLNCALSKKTKELLQIMGADYYEEVLPQNDEWSTPRVFLEDDYIGGYKSLQAHFNRRIRNAKKKKKSATTKPTTPSQDDIHEGRNP